MSPIPQIPKERTRRTNRILMTQLAALLRSAMSMRMGSEGAERARKNGRHHRVGSLARQQGKARRNPGRAGQVEGFQRACYHPAPDIEFGSFEEIDDRACRTPAFDRRKLEDEQT